MIKNIYGAGGGGGGGGGGGSKEPDKPRIAQDDPALKSISFAKMQFLLCEGEIEGPAFGNTKEGLEKSVFLDDTPIRSSTDEVNPEPEDLVFSWGRDYSSQTGVPDYNRVTQVESVDTTCAYQKPVNKSVTAAVTTGTYYARVLLTWDALMASTVDGDRASGNTGDVRVQFCGYRISYLDSAGVERSVQVPDTKYGPGVLGKFSSSFQRAHEFLLEGVGPTWTIKVERTSPDDDSYNPAAQVVRSTFNFSSVALSLDQKFSYPYSSMLSVGVRADNYSAIPNVSIELKGLKVDVPTNFDPIARTFNGAWDGTWKRAWTDCPPFILRDIILHDRYGAGQYIDESAVDKWSLYELAQYCCEQVPAPGGGTEPRFTCNLLLQTGEEAWKVLQQISSIFRGLIYYASSLAVVTQDRDKDPIFTFNETNTIERLSGDGKVSEGNFNYSGIARRARHTVVLVSYDDPTNNYETRIEYVTDDETFEAYGYRPMDLRLLGVTSRGQALRAANWALLSERLLDDTVTFSTNEIGMTMRPGDVIKIADPTKAAVRAGGRIKAVNGLDITLDSAPTNPPGGYTGATLSWMYSDADNQPAMQSATITGTVTPGVDSVVTIDSDGGNPPVPSFPFLLEFTGRSAQLFRVLTVAQGDGGVYDISALRYREDIYDSVDFDTPLEEDQNYLFTVLAPGVPTGVFAQVVWDNGSFKLEARWAPPEASTVLHDHDLNVRAYRVQWEAGTVQPDDTVIWSGAWRELPYQEDDREMIPIENLAITDKFRIRVASIGRLGVQSDWSAVVVADDIDDWMPMPDLSAVPNVLTFLNQQSGSQLFTWNFAGVGAIPPYVSGVRLEAKPNNPLDATQAKGLRLPDADGWYVYGDYDLEKYAVGIFHADTNWSCRLSLNTTVDGLRGSTYATTTVTRDDIVPPAPEEFVVVTDTDTPSLAPMRRFSWKMPSTVINDDAVITRSAPGARIVSPNWPLGKVTDIKEFLVRYKAGFSNDWDLAVPLFADGIPGDQRYFETSLFDGGVWTVMIRAVDVTGWISDNQASIVVNFGDAIPTNVVESYPTTPSWTGQKVNMQINGSGELEQIDPAVDGEYFYAFTSYGDGTGLVINTDSEGTYQWFVRQIGEDVNSLIYPDPQGDPMYPNPQTDYMYLDTSKVVGTDYHPYVPFEKLKAGDYEIAVRVRSIDGTTPTVLKDVVVNLDYPDIVQTMTGVTINATTQRIYFPKPFPTACKTVTLTLQDPPGTVTLPATAYVRGKDPSYFEVRLLDPSGNVIAGLADVHAVGY